MANYKSLLIILGLILVVVGALLFNPLRFWGIIALVVGLIALARAFTFKSVEKETKEEVKEEKEPEEAEESSEEELEENTEEEPETEEETEKIDEEEIEEERENKQ